MKKVIKAAVDADSFEPQDMRDTNADAVLGVDYSDVWFGLGNGFICMLSHRDNYEFAINLYTKLSKLFEAKKFGAIINELMSYGNAGFSYKEKWLGR